jgi:hypothetical protein
MRLVLGAVLVLVMILAGSARAQGTPAGPPPAGTSSSPTTPPIADGAGPVTAGPPAPALTPPSATPPVPPPPPDAPQLTLRPAAEVVVGGLLGTAGLVGGAFGGFALQCTIGCHGDFAGIEGLLLGAALGLATGTAAGVELAGSDHQHTGSFGWTWLGAVGGGAAGLLAAGRADNGTQATVIVIGGAALGATIAFELTRTRRGPSTAVRLVPLISGGGVQLALVGAR